MENYKVYKHSFPNGKVYVGITKQKVNERFKNGRGYERSPLMWKAICKYGWDNIKHDILFENLTKEQAENKEIELIYLYKSNQGKYGYNIQNGGNCVGSVSEETKKKISVANKGKISKLRGIPRNEEVKRKVSIANKGRKPWTTGKKLPKETKEKISNSLKGHKISEKTKDSLIMFQKGNIPWNKGKKMTKEYCKKMSEAKKGKKLSEIAKQKISKKIICLETGIVYKSGIEAYRQTGINYRTINLCCNKQQKTSGGYHWEFYKED